LLRVAQRKTAEADVTLDDRGRAIEADLDEFGDNVLIVDPAASPIPAPAGKKGDKESKGKPSQAMLPGF